MAYDPSDYVFVVYGGVVCAIVYVCVVQELLFFQAVLIPGAQLFSSIVQIGGSSEASSH